MTSPSKARGNRSGGKPRWAACGCCGSASAARPTLLPNGRGTRRSHHWHGGISGGRCPSRCRIRRRSRHSRVDERGVREPDRSASNRAGALTWPAIMACPEAQIDASASLRSCRRAAVYNLDLGVELVLEIGVEVGNLGREDVPDPRLALVRDDAEIPDTGDRVGSRRGTERSRVVTRGEEDVMVELVLLFPPIHEDEIASAAVVDAEEPDAVACRGDGRSRQDPLGGRLGGLDQFWPCGLASVRDRVLLDPPVAPPPRSERSDRTRGVRLCQLDHPLPMRPRHRAHRRASAFRGPVCHTPMTFPAGSRNVATHRSPSGYGAVTTLPPWATTWSSVSLTRSTKMYGRIPASPATGRSAMKCPITWPLPSAKLGSSRST